MKKHLVFKMIFFTLVFASCKSQMNKEGTLFSSMDGIPDMELVTPYADMSLLDNTRSATISDPDIVNWKVARFFALLEKLEFEEIYPSWKDSDLSKQPVIIYYADSDKPRYYEFRVIKGNEEIGTITCNASKKEGKPVAYVSEMAHKVRAKVARELISNIGSVRLVAANYPNQFVMRNERIDQRSVEEGKVDFKNALTSETIDKGSLFIDQRLDVLLKDADAKKLKELDITEDERVEILNNIAEKEAFYTKIWQDIDEAEEKIIAFSDEEIKRRTLEDKKILNLEIKPKVLVGYQDGSKIYDNFLEDWYSKRRWSISCPGWKIWCGPYAVAFITLGLGDKSGCEGVPSYDNSKKFGNLYLKFRKHMGWGPLLINHLSDGLSQYTNYKIERVRSHRWQDVEDHLKNYKLPVVSLRSDILFKSAGWHYRTIIGTAIYWREETHMNWWSYLFGLEGSEWTEWHRKYWYYMHDAGVDSRVVEDYVGNKKEGNFWELDDIYYQQRIGLVKHQ